MDPTANIERQREVVRKIRAMNDLGAGPGTEDEREYHALVNELLELVEALDEWRLRGGFDPYN